jgi:hypothetical protein
MAAGWSYDEVIDRLNPSIPVGEHWMHFALQTHAGFAVRQTYLVGASFAVTTDPAMRRLDISSFAIATDTAVCHVMVGKSPHYVVLLQDGTVLDPSVDAPRTLADYTSVVSITELVKLRELEGK